MSAVESALSIPYALAFAALAALISGSNAGASGTGVPGASGLGPALGGAVELAPLLTSEKSEPPPGGAAPAALCAAYAC